jgi:tetratricopeptide (TPR) repeat protein
MTFVRSFVGVFLCCLALAASAPAMAADLEQGRAAFAEGQKAYLAGDYRGALTWFKNGYAQTQDPAFLLNMAQCHRSLGEASKALTMFRLYLKSAPEGTNPEARAVATKAVKELESEAKTTPSETTTAAASSLAPESVLGPASTRATAAPGASPTPVIKSSRRFDTGPGGMPVLEPTPELDAAKAAAAAAHAPDPTAATRRHLRWAALACGAVGLVSVGTGIYYWTRANSLSDSANQAAVYHRATYDDGKHAETMQWIFYGVGAAAVATGAGLFLYSMRFPARRPATVSLAPMATPGAAGLAAVGVF